VTATGTQLAVLHAILQCSPGPAGIFLMAQCVHHVGVPPQPHVRPASQSCMPCFSEGNLALHGGGEQGMWNRSAKGCI
jgi:hypothetical protein